PARKGVEEGGLAHVVGTCQRHQKQRCLGIQTRQHVPGQAAVQSLRQGRRRILPPGGGGRALEGRGRGGGEIAGQAPAEPASQPATLSRRATALKCICPQRHPVRSGVLPRGAPVTVGAVRSRSLLTLLAPLALMGLAGCSSCANKTREASPPADASAEVRAAAAEAPVPFIHDDYPAALAEARKRGVPLFIDFWAPWCHTCRHMNANVFPDPGLSRQGEHYVFLSVDTEKPQNAEVVKQFPVQVWPTLLVIDPGEETAVLKWLGSADLDQLNALLDDARLAMKGGEEGHSALLARADRLAAQGEPGAAAAVLAQLLEEVPRDWPRRSRAVESRLMVLALGGVANPEACARLALDELAQLPKTSSWARIASWG